MNDSEFSMLDILDGRIVILVGLFLCLVLIIIEPSMGGKVNYIEQQKKLKEINLEKIKAKEIENFFTETFYNEKEFEFTHKAVLNKKEISEKNKKIIIKLNEALKNKNEIEIEEF